ncbi:conserved hypothetical protein [Coccidioides posadasii str. Silveira]|uniref:Tse2 ADP-ribosyltransferase toxin domain-containing protein n=1 Tax=Coccidioides posadasii (strain RMSCC 757 / Silveira) TaxID=443226 RepID=E9D7T6_COCPS|nr:conserved hypothetical protein [Coccidioides posadasii str. Silveira]
MRPNTAKTQRLVSTLRGNSACIYSARAGTQVPDDLILVHEFKDHYSLQARKEMTVDDLNTKITGFLRMTAQCLTNEEWLWQYPMSTETE